MNVAHGRFPVAIGLETHLLVVGLGDRVFLSDERFDFRQADLDRSLSGGRKQFCADARSRGVWQYLRRDNAPPPQGRAASFPPCRPDKRLDAEKLAILASSQRARNSNGIAYVVLQNELDIGSSSSLSRSDELLKHYAHSLGVVRRRSADSDVGRSLIRA